MYEGIIITAIGSIFGLIAGLLGVIVGYILNEKAAKRREQDNNERHSRAIRTVLGIEVNANLRAIRAGGKELQEVNRTELSQEGRAIIATYFDRWQTDIWKTHLGVVATALSAPELQHIYHFYDGLHNIDTGIEVFKIPVQATKHL